MNTKSGMIALDTFYRFNRTFILISIFMFALFLYGCNSEPVDENTYMKNAKEHYDTDYYLGAIQEYTKALELNSELQEAYQYRGMSSHELQRFDVAVKDFTKLITMNDKNDKYYELRSTSYLGLAMDPFGGRSENYNELSISDATKAFELNPNNDVAHYNIGRVYLEMQKYTDAIAKFDEAIAINPAHGRAIEYRLMANSLLNPVKETDTGYTNIIASDEPDRAVDEGLDFAQKEISAK